MSEDPGKYDLNEHPSKLTADDLLKLSIEAAEAGDKAAIKSLLMQVDGELLATGTISSFRLHGWFCEYLHEHIQELPADAHRQNNTDEQFGLALRVAIHRHRGLKVADAIEQVIQGTGTKLEFDTINVYRKRYRKAAEAWIAEYGCRLPTSGGPHRG